MKEWWDKLTAKEVAGITLIVVGIVGVIGIINIFVNAAAVSKVNNLVGERFRLDEQMNQLLTGYQTIQKILNGTRDKPDANPGPPSD